MVRSRQESALKAQQELAAQFEPGLTILARVTPAWPAMVINEADLPASVLKVKPSKKVVIPVLFYNDGSFQWISPSEAEFLDKPTAAKTSKSKIKKQLKEAYAIAADPPSYEQVLESINTPAEDAAEPEDAVVQSEGVEEEHEMDVEEPKSSKPRRARSAAEQASGIPRAKRAKLSSEKQASKPAKAPQQQQKQEDEESEYVDSGSAESTETSSGVDTGAETTDGEFDEKSLAKKQTLRYDLCLEARKVLQELLVNPVIKEDGSQIKEEVKSEEIKSEEESKNGEATTEESNVEEVEIPKIDISSDQLKHCEDLLNTVLSAPIEISVLRRSKLSRVVTFVLQTTIPESLREKLDKVASEYNTQSEPIIRGIPEHLAPTEEEEQTRENTEEPQSHFPSEAPSEGPSESQAEVPSEAPSEAPAEAAADAPSEAPSEAPAESEVNVQSTEEAKPNGDTPAETATEGSGLGN